MTDREIDALIAEKVMGCKPVPLIAGAGWRCGCSDDESQEGHNDKRQERQTFLSRQTLIAYSTDIAAAWTVVEKMAESGWEVDIAGLGKAYRVAFWNRDSAVGKTRSMFAAKAICLAALKAVGVNPTTDGGGR